MNLFVIKKEINSTYFSSSLDGGEGLSGPSRPLASTVEKIKL